MRRSARRLITNWVVVKTNVNSCFGGNWKCGSLMTSEIVVLKTNVNMAIGNLSGCFKKSFMKQTEICESRKMLH